MERAHEQNTIPTKRHLTDLTNRKCLFASSMNMDTAHDTDNNYFFPPKEQTQEESNNTLKK